MVKLNWKHWLLLGGMVTLMTKWLMPERCKQYAEIFRFVETNYKLPPNLLARMAYKESNCDPLAVSKAGAQGIMQIIPKWHPGVDPFKPAEAIHHAGKYMRENFDRFGSWRAALAAYNWGPSNVQRALKNHGGSIDAMLQDVGRVPLETRDYVAKISTDVGVA